MSLMSQLEIFQPADTDRTMGADVFSWAGQNVILEHDEISAALFDNANVLSVLRHAFKLGLSRGVSWDVSRVETDLSLAVAIAARVLKLKGRL